MSSRLLVRHNGTPCPFTTVITLITVHFILMIMSSTKMVAVQAESSLATAKTSIEHLPLRQTIHFPADRNLQATTTTDASTKLYLMDAVTDQIVQDLTSTAVTWINTKDAIVPRYNVQAILSNSTMKIMSMMAWQYNGALRTEFVAPWALCGNSGLDFVPCTKLVSTTMSSSSANDVASLHVASISATPHQKGTNGADVPIANAAATATIVMAPVNVHPFTVTIVNADSDIDIVTLPLSPSTAPDHSPYALKRSILPPRFNVRYNLHPYFTQNGSGGNDKVSSMLLSWNHSSLSSGTVPLDKDALTFHSKMEYGAPFALFGNAGSDYWTGPTVNNVTVVQAPGLIQLSAALFGSNGQGSRPILTHSMTIVLQNDRPTAPVPAPTTPNTTKTSKIELQQLTLSTNTIDVSLDDDAIVSMQVQLAEFADSASTALVGFVQATLQGRGLNATTLPLIVPLGEKTTVTSGDVQVHSYKIDMHLSPYQALGIYDLTVLVWDADRTEYTWNRSALQMQKLPHTLQVTSSSDNAVAADTVAPDLMSLVRLPSNNSQTQTHSFMMHIHDAGSGFRMGTLEAVHVDSLDVVSVDFAMDDASSSFENSAVNDNPTDESTTDTTTLNVTLTFASTVPRGMYALRIYLYDAVLNQMIVETSELEARQWPSRIALV